MPYSVRSGLWMVAMLLWAHCAYCQVQPDQILQEHPRKGILAELTDSSTLDVRETLSMLPGAGPGWGTLQEADKALAAGDYKTALHRFMQAHARFEKDNDEAGVCVTLLKSGNLYQHWKVYERALTYFQDAEELALKLHMPEGFMQNIWLRQAACAQNINQTAVATTAYKQLLQSYQLQKFTKGERFVLGKLAELYQHHDQFPEALAYFKKLAALELAEHNAVNLAMANNNVGFILKRMNRCQEALPYLESAIAEFVRTPAHSAQAVLAFINISSAYNQLHQYDPALAYLQQGLMESAAKSNATTEAELLNFIALTYFNKGAYDRGLKTVDKAIVVASRQKRQDVLANCYRTKAQLCDNVLNYAEGSRYHQLYAELKDSIRYEERLREQSALLRDLNVERLEKELRMLITDTEKNQLVLRQSALESEGEIRKKEVQLLQREKMLQDYTYQAQALELERVIMRKKQLESQNAMRLSELERKESEIRINQYRKKINERAQQAQIRLLAKDKVLLEQTRKSQQLHIQGQKDREKYLFGVVLLAMTAVSLTYVGLSKMKTANLKLRVKQDEVVQQKESVERMFGLLESKNRSITDSIKYARRIQGVIVPGPDRLNQAIPLSFVFLRARDVVSGDVYFLYRDDRYTIIASMDCTGHGVPGAMLSLLGYQTLHNIVAGTDVRQPHLILHALDAAMAEVLRIDQTDMQQGMDVGLAIIDRRERRLHFSGAVHNLIYFQHGEMHEVKASRCSIGGLVPRDQKAYSSITLSVSDHMQCYLSSDGLSTQLGGEQGKKFSSARLKELYKEIAPLSAASKKAAIEKAADDWMGKDYRQLDDMLVVGFRADLAV